MMDEKIAKAFGHAIRVRLLEALNHRIASAPELALQLDLPESTVNYHVGVLRECNCVRVATTRRRKGKEVRFYTAKHGIFHSSSHIKTAIEHRLATTPVFEGFLQKAQSAADAGLVDRQEKATFAVETLSFTENHRKAAEEALHLTIANLRMLAELSRQLHIATDTPVSTAELGIALIPSCNATEE